MLTHEEQVHRSILNTMHGRAAGASADNVNALAAFIRSLPPAPGVAAARGEADTDAVRRGKSVFAELRCGRCHGAPDYTSERTYDVGLADAAGQTRFNPPSLLGVSQRDAYLHDGRAASLREVFEKHGHPDGRGTEGKSLDDLVAFLESL
jgi:cytochrome c peroxidase